jgi:hypothetical protein
MTIPATATLDNVIINGKPIVAQSPIAYGNFYYNGLIAASTNYRVEDPAGKENQVNWNVAVQKKSGQRHALLCRQ